MLHAIGFPDDQMPQLLVHGWWNLGGAKMSKSVGNIIDPFVLSINTASDALRYYLMSDMATGKDADFSEERLIERYNTDLANSLGNLLNRTLNMVHRYRDGRLTSKDGGCNPSHGILRRLSFKFCMSGSSVDDAIEQQAISLATDERISSSSKPLRGS